MNPLTSNRPPRLPTLHARAALQKRLLWFGGATALLIACFYRPLASLTNFALHSDLYSHILLIPFISFYLIWVSRESLEPDDQPSWLGAAGPFFAGVALLVGYKLGWFGRGQQVDHLALMDASFLCFWLASALLFLGAGFLRRYIFAVVLLVFAIPFPTLVRDGIEWFFQRGSAETSYAFLMLSGMPMIRDHLVFHMPAMSIQVAPECSGIHSSLVLFITSLLAGHLFLLRASNRWLLALAVIPLALLRNGLRIFVIAQLCVQINPNMIDKPIHTRGGPIFFALSLIPFFLMLWYLRQLEVQGEIRRKQVNQLESVL